MAETAKERQARLQLMNDHQQNRRVDETVDERQARLQLMSDRQWNRRADETADERHGSTAATE